MGKYKDLLEECFSKEEIAEIKKEVQLEAKALEDIKRRNFFNKANAAYEALKSDPIAWQEELQERAEWEGF